MGIMSHNWNVSVPKHPFCGGVYLDPYAKKGMSQAFILSKKRKLKIEEHETK